MLLVMGAFASMALNSYGVGLMAYTMLGFAIAFLLDLILILPRQQSILKSDKRLLGAELVLLALLCLIYFSEGVNALIPFASWILFISIVLLMLINVYHFYQSWRSEQRAPLKLKIAIACYFTALILLYISNYLPGFLGRVGSLTSLILIAVFLVIGWWRGIVLIEGEEVTAMQRVVRYKNKSGIQLIILGLVTAYYLLSSLNILPPLYVGSMPNAHQQVVREWQQDNSKTSPQDFEQAYKTFLEGK
jgi:hypothetical protein